MKFLNTPNFLEQTEIDFVDIGAWFLEKVSIDQA